MPGQPVVNTYKRYKAGTQKLVNWLVDSADRCSNNTPRPKRARKAKRKIRTADLINFATAIVDSKNPLIDISLEILDVTKDAINGREDCYEFYCSLDITQLPDLIKDNAGHRYFLDILIKVFEILKKEHKARRPKRKKKMPELATDTNDLANLYQHLELEELSDDDASPAPQSSTESTNTPSKHNADSEIELDNEQEEKLFAFWAMLKDLHDVRNSARAVWQQYKAGQVSIRAACRATANAQWISGNAGNEYHISSDSLSSSYDWILIQLGLQWVEDQARMHQTTTKVNNLGSSSHATTAAHAAELMMLDGWITLTDLRSAHWVSKCKDPKHKLPRLPQLDTKLERHALTYVLISLLPDIGKMLEMNKGKVSHSGPWTDSLDQSTRSIMKVLDDGTATLGDVAATALAIDMYDALDGHLDRCLRELEPQIIDRPIHSLNYLKQFTSQHGFIGEHIGPGPIEFLEDFVVREQRHAIVQGKVCWIFHDDRLGKQNDIAVPVRMLQSLPMLPAMLCEETLYGLQELGPVMCSNDQIVLAAAHLYKAVQLSGGQTASWDDMDMILAAQHRAKDPLLRPNEDSLALLAKQYGLSLGMTLKQCSGKERPRLSFSACSKKSVRVKAIALWQSSKCDVLEQYKSLGFSKDSGDSSLYECVRNYHAHGPGMRIQSIAQQWQETRKLSPVQLFEVLHEICLYEEPFANFDYFGFVVDCIRLLHIAAEAEADFLGDTQLTSHGFETVYDILWDAGQAEAAGFPKQSTLLHNLVPVVQDFVKRRGKMHQNFDVKALSLGTPAILPGDGACTSLLDPHSLTPQVEWNLPLEMIKGRLTAIDILTKWAMMRAFRDSQSSGEEYMTLLKERLAALDVDLEDFLVVDFTMFGEPAPYDPGETEGKKVARIVARNERMTAVVEALQ